MPAKGTQRYKRLLQHIKNPGEYIFRKGDRLKRPLSFTTKPHAITFPVTEGLYQVFKEIFMEDVYDIADLVAPLPAKPVIIDIGANAGFFNIILLSKIKEARILAYEPIKQNVAYIKALQDNNPIIKNGIEVFEQAVTGTAQGDIKLFMANTEDNQVVASVVDGFNKDNTKEVVVKTITLTEIIEQNNLQQIDILKMDCEGSEYDILYNTDPALIQRAKHLALEVHDIDEGTKNYKTMKPFLEGLGYTVTGAAINEFCFAVNAIKKN